MRAQRKADREQKLTEVVDGQLRIVSASPTIVPMRDMSGRASAGAFVDAVGTERIVRLALSGYLQTLPTSTRELVGQYRGVDAAVKVVGVGSVGTRAFIVVMEGAGRDDPLVLQIKEAQESVLGRFCGKSAFEQHGQRVVEGQRAMQAASDVMLGWCRLPGEGGKMRESEKPCRTPRPAKSATSCRAWQRERP